MTQDVEADEGPVETAFPVKSRLREKSVSPPRGMPASWGVSTPVAAGRGSLSG